MTFPLHQFIGRILKYLLVIDLGRDRWLTKIKTETLRSRCIICLWKNYIATSQIPNTVYNHFFFFFFFFFGCTCGIWRFLGQGLNPSCMHDLRHSCGNSWFLIHCTRQGIKPVPQQQPKLLQIQCQLLNPLWHSGSSYTAFYNVYSRSINPTRYPGITKEFFTQWI